MTSTTEPNGAGEPPVVAGEPPVATGKTGEPPELRRARELVEDRSYVEARELLLRLYQQAPVPRRTVISSNPVASLLSRISGVTNAIVLLLPLAVCLSIPGFSRWGLSFAAFAWAACAVPVAFVLGTAAGYIAWRPGQGWYLFIYVLLVAGNTVQWTLYMPEAIGMFVAAHLLGALCALILVAVAARSLARAALGPKLFFATAVTLALWSLDGAYGATPWALPLVSVGAVLTGPLWGRFFPERPERR